jgi:hypothetical protein
MVAQAALAVVLARETTNNMAALVYQGRAMLVEILETRAVIHILPLVAEVLEPLVQVLLQLLFQLLLAVKAVMVLFLQFLGQQLLMQAVAVVVATTWVAAVQVQESVVLAVLVEVGLV